MFGGGTLAVVVNPGALVVKNEDRDAMLATMTVVAPGNALVILDASQSGARAPAPKRLADAVAAAGGTVRQFQSPKGGALTGWIDAEARERGLTLVPGAAKLLAERIGGNVQEADAERRHQTRIASMELDKLALYRGTAPIGPDDVTALVAEAVPGSVWAFTDAVGERAWSRPSTSSTGCSRRRRSPSSWRSCIVASVSSSRPATGWPRANGSRRSARRWASTANTGWASSETRPGRGRHPS